MSIQEDLNNIKTNKEINEEVNEDVNNEKTNEEENRLYFNQGSRELDVSKFVSDVQP